MAGQTLKAQTITNLDANPPVRGSAGKFGFGRRMEMSDYVSPGAADDNTSIYKLVRVPSNARDLQVFLESHGTIVTLTGDVTIYYSDLAADEVGKSQGLSGLVNSLNGTSSLFAHSVAMATADTPVEVTNKNAKYDVTLRQKELWDAAGLSSDPGGFFDIVFLPTSTNSLTAGATLAARVSFVAGYWS